MRYSNIRLLSCAIAVMAMSSSASAKDLFSIELMVDGTTGRSTYASIEDIIDAVDDRSLSRIVSSYNSTSVATAVLSIRGIPATVEYRTSGTTLTFSAPAAGVDEISFTGSSRDESQQLLEDYLKTNSDGILKKLLNYAVANTAVDPVAGNPSSLMGMMAANDFSQGTELDGGSPLVTNSASARANAFGIGARFGQYSATGFEQNVYTIPIAYTVPLDNPGYQLKFQMPVTYIDTEGTATYSGSLGIGVRVPVTDDWSLTPAARVGSVGSIDLGSAAVVYSGSLSSNYNMHYSDLKFTIGNTAGYFQTKSIDAGDYEIAYDLTNQMIKNGIGVEGPLDFAVFGEGITWQTSIANTQFFGDELYIENYTDISMSFGTRATDTSWSSLRVGVTYSFGSKDYDGARMNFGYTF